MIHYSTNWMGPVSLDWTQKHGDCWAGGRIDIYGSEYPDEYALRLMHVEDWGRLSCWLDQLETETQWSYEKIIEQFEQHHGSKIRWWNFDEEGNK